MFMLYLTLWTPLCLSGQFYIKLYLVTVLTVRHFNTVQLLLHFKYLGKEGIGWKATQGEIIILYFLVLFRQEQMARIIKRPYLDLFLRSGIEIIGQPVLVSPTHILILFYMHFSIVSLYNTSKLLVSSYRSQFSHRNVIFGLREPCTIENLRLLKNFENPIFYG